MIDPTLILMIFLSFTNGKRAMRKGYNRWVWSLFTLIGFILGEIIGGMVVVFYFCRDVIDINRLASDISYNTTAVQILKDEFSQHPIRWITIDLFGLGGYLAVRFLIEKMQEKNNPEPSVPDNASV